MILAVVLLFAIGASALPSHHGPSHRIIGGFTAYDGLFPHQVSIKLNNNHQCGGSILDSKTILTAAHCSYGFSGYFSIDVGTVLLNKGGVRHRVLQIRMHENYNPRNLHNDISIAKVEGHIVFGEMVSTIGLQPVYVEKDIWAEFIGWGETQNGGLPDILQYTYLPTISMEECRSRHPAEPEIVDSQLCTFRSDAAIGICGGDSGGPLTVNKGLAGIASWIRGCAGGFPDVFTRVSSYLDWIERNKV